MGNLLLGGIKAKPWFHILADSQYILAILPDKILANIGTDIADMANITDIDNRY